MTHSFSFSTAGRIVFGDGEARNLAKHLASVLPDFTRRSAPCLVVTGSTEQRARPVLEALEVGNLDCEVVSVSGEPGFEDAKEAIDAGAESVPGSSSAAVVEAPSTWPKRPAPYSPTTEISWTTWK